jgi:hypothetical protein
MFDETAMHDTVYLPIKITFIELKDKKNVGR